MKIIGEVLGCVLISLGGVISWTNEWYIGVPIHCVFAIVGLILIKGGIK